MSTALPLLFDFQLQQLPYRYDVLPSHIRQAPSISLKYMFRVECRKQLCGYCSAAEEPRYMVARIMSNAGFESCRLAVYQVVVKTGAQRACDDVPGACTND